MKRWMKIAAACTLTAAVAATAAGFTLMPRAGQQEQIAPAAWFALSQGQLIKTVETSGRISSQETSRVTAPTDRVIKSVSAKLGQQVKAGQVLALLDVSGLQQELEKGRKTAEEELEQGRRTVETREREYENAKFSADLGEISQEELRKAQDELANARSAYEGKKNAGQNEQLHRQIAEAVLKAPASGTITAMNAETGVMSSGVLFTIENTKRLQVTTFVSEYDVNAIQPGMKAVIKTEMTGEETFQGEVLSVAPAAANIQGEKSGSGKVQFQVDVGIAEGSDKIRIGGNAQVSIITQQKEGVFTVPFEALIKTPEGASVRAAVQEGQGYVVKEIMVTTGLESDTAVEISGEALSPGVKILQTPEDLSPGEHIEIMESEEGEQE